MATYICKHCKKKFRRNQRSKFCSLKCCWDWRKQNGATPGAFKKGMTPWNAGTKGVMKPNSGSFKKGESNKKQPLGSITYRKEKLTGHKRAWIKIADNGNSYDWELRAVYIWKKYKGEIPEGMIVHHRDRNKLNDKISNLQLLTRAEHLLEHRLESESKRLQNASKATKERHERNRIARKSNPSAP